MRPLLNDASSRENHGFPLFVRLIRSLTGSTSNRADGEVASLRFCCFELVFGLNWSQPAASPQQNVWLTCRPQTCRLPRRRTRFLLEGARVLLFLRHAGIYLQQGKFGLRSCELAASGADLHLCNFFRLYCQEKLNIWTCSFVFSTAPPCVNLLNEWASKVRTLWIPLQ